MRSLLIDLDGVLYRGDKVIPGAVETVRWVINQQIPHLFLTNTTSRPRAALVEKLAGFGIDARVQDILSPPVAACGWLRTHAPGSVALFVPEETKSEFGSLPQIDVTDAHVRAKSVVLGDLGELWTYELLNRAFRLLMADGDVQLVSLGLTRFWRASDGLRLDVAPFCRALECATGRKAVVLGKPAKDFFETATAILECEAGQAVMIGDDIVSDVQGAQNARICGVLVCTGKFEPAQLDGNIEPDAILDSIAGLPEWWAKSGES